WASETFSPKLPVEDYRELVHGGSFLNMNCGVKGVGRKQGQLDFNTPSGMVKVYQHEDGSALLLGVLPPLGGGFSIFRTLHDEPHLEGAFGFEISFDFQRLVEPGETVAASPILALSGGDGIALLTEYGRLWRQLGTRKLRTPQIGWNSWDYRAGAITRADCDENLAEAGKLFGDALQVFCIDEGYEVQWGTWEPNNKFSEGLEDYCRHVKNAGCTPGIWTAPLLVNTYNPLFYEKPEWFASRADGQLQTDSYAYGPMAYLDTTRDDVLAYIRDVFIRMREAGFEYYKVDFSHCALKPVKFADPHVGRNDLIRRAFETIREAIGPDAYLLGCGAPFESVYGSVDAVRSAGDIHIYWGHILRNAANIAARWWMQGNLWNCDPDFLIVRGPDTAEPPYFKRRMISPMGPEGGWTAGREFNEMEAQTYALLVHLSGGDVMLGDRLTLLNDKGTDMLRRVLQPRCPAADPVDMFETEQDMPRIWISRGDQDILVGLFNWTEKTARLHFDPAAHGLQGIPTDFWTGEPIPSLPDRMRRRSSIALRYTL
ncbi:MAG: alpha-galactosidase, partial [Lentisphaeria bacterium]|nr:alpha-galactosidase [Lentisphaeria bacterium]